MAKYIKVLNTSGAVIDAIENPTYVTWNATDETIEVCESSAINVMGVISSSTTMIWQIDGKELFPEWLGLLSVVCEDIEKQEYDALVEQLKPNNDAPEDIVPEPSEEERLQERKDKKINQMSRRCSEVITEGVDVELSDGNTYHFSLTVEDQLNLITISAMIAEGQTVLPYHADDEQCVFFSAEDMLKVIDTATNFKTYHTTYFNSLKTYILALETIEEVDSLYYGVDIPEEYQSPVWKEIGGNESN